MLIFPSNSRSLFLLPTTDFLKLTKMNVLTLLCARVCALANLLCDTRVYDTEG